MGRSSFSLVRAPRSKLSFGVPCSSSSSREPLSANNKYSRPAFCSRTPPTKKAAAGVSYDLPSRRVVVCEKILFFCKKKNHCCHSTHTRHDSTTPRRHDGAARGGRASSSYSSSTMTAEHDDTYHLPKCDRDVTHRQFVYILIDEDSLRISVL